MKTKPTAPLSDAARLELRHWMTTATPEERVRARCILMAETNAHNGEISLAVGLSRHAVGKWRTRYAALGLDGIKEPRRGRMPRFSAEAIEAVISLHLLHKNSGESWPLRKLARATGMSLATVQKILKVASQEHFGAPDLSAASIALHEAAAGQTDGSHP
ncbi:helix-turn-helix domain-containing protein [Chelatococcus sp. YT9]|uniref:helix-turn-helix domain-containing protein n=1 Tax=Chelatococcus sp. YT9 TaxID=2835635 RepID=UPI001BCE9E9B|nr:helix-turn-helix domain-containing protein [Chelatococcus sp. YT9]MBS7701462.1 helix-turn-helix domain-containing protein [Chelatococcus sp. YT9]